MENIKNPFRESFDGGGGGMHNMNTTSLVWHSATIDGATFYKFAPF